MVYNKDIKKNNYLKNVKEHIKLNKDSPNYYYLPERV